MKLIQHTNGVVVDIRDVREGTEIADLALVEAVPKFEPRENCNGVLMYGADGLYWDYVEVPQTDEVSGEELAAMIGEVL